MHGVGNLERWALSHGGIFNMVAVCSNKALVVVIRSSSKVLLIGKGWSCSGVDGSNLKRGGHLWAAQCGGSDVIVNHMG